MKPIRLILALCSLAVAAAASAQPDTRFNRAPLQPRPYAELPIGAVKPAGWLNEQLVRMRDGMTGHLDSLYPQVMGPRNGWLGGDGDVWERGPYWIDGLLPLAYILGDRQLIEKTRPWSSGRSAAGSPTAISARRKTVRSKARPYSATTPATGGPRWSCSRCCNNTTRRRATSASSN